MASLRARGAVQSFWQPQDTPDSAIRPDKPSMDVVCPVSGKKLRLKDLTPVKFTAAPDDSGSLFMDPLSKDMLTNSSTIVVLKPTGDAMLMTTYVQCVKPDGHYDGASAPIRCAGAAHVDICNLYALECSACTDRGLYMVTTARIVLAVQGTR